MEAQEIPRNRGLLFANQYPAKAKGDTGSSPACNIAKNFSNDITCPFISSDSPAYTLSKRAPSTTRPPIRLGVL